MPNDATSPYATYLSHLQKGELAYQFSPAANRAVFFPRLLCPYSGSDQLEWRVSKGRLMSRVEDVAPMDVKIGMRVKFRAHKPGGEEDPIPVFSPEAA